LKPDRKTHNKKYSGFICSPQNKIKLSVCNYQISTMEESTRKRHIIQQQHQQQQQQYASMKTSAYRLHFSCEHIGKYRSYTKRKIKW
jgi:hypothetical protein